MFITFTYPFALLAALGILLPVLIHLWNRKSKKVLVVGSIKHLTEGKRQQLKKWYISDWPLFLLRCALLLCLSLFLSSPKIRQGENSSEGKGWVLLGKGYQAELDEKQEKEVDSLLKAGYELRAFETGFPLIKSKGKDTVGDVTDYFSLVKQLDARLPTDFSVSLFTSGAMNRFAATPPAIGFQLDWQSFGRPDSTAVSWVQKAWKASDDSMKVLMAVSSVAGTYSKIIGLQDDGRKQGMLLQVENGIPKLKTAIQTDWVPVEQEPLKIQLLTAGSSSDQQYVEAFIKAFGDYTSFPIVLTTFQRDKPCDFLFDLSGKPLQMQEYREAEVVFRYADGREENSNSVNNKLLYAHLAGNAQPPNLYKMIPTDDSARAVWTDVYDRPVLTAAEKEGRLLFTFYSRFNPQWTDLVWSKDLVDYLVPLLFPESILPGITEQRKGGENDQGIYRGRIQLPVSLKETKSATYWMPIETYLIWLALLLFAWERIMSYQRKRKELSHGRG